MSKVTSKLQLTLPKAIADQYGIRPGDELDWVPAGETIRVIVAKKGPPAGQRLSLEERLELFDRATERQRRRNEAWRKRGATAVPQRGWKREDLYTRGFPR